MRILCRWAEQLLVLRCFRWLGGRLGRLTASADTVRVSLLEAGMVRFTCSEAVEADRGRAEEPGREPDLLPVLQWGTNASQ